jgi:hypothetical protein
VDARHAVVVDEVAREKRGSRWAADRRVDEEIAHVFAIVEETSTRLVHREHRAEAEILIISEQHDDVRLLREHEV